MGGYLPRRGEVKKNYLISRLGTKRKESTAKELLKKTDQKPMEALTPGSRAFKIARTTKGEKAGCHSRNLSHLP